MSIHYAERHERETACGITLGAKPTTATHNAGEVTCGRCAPKVGAQRYWGSKRCHGCSGEGRHNDDCSNGLKSI